MFGLGTLGKLKLRKPCAGLSEDEMSDCCDRRTPCNHVCARSWEHAYRQEYATKMKAKEIVTHIKLRISGLADYTENGTGRESFIHKQLKEILGEPD